MLAVYKYTAVDGYYIGKSTDPTLRIVSRATCNVYDSDLSKNATLAGGFVAIMAKPPPLVLPATPWGEFIGILITAGAFEVIGVWPDADLLEAEPRQQSAGGVVAGIYFGLYALDLIAREQQR